jgi:hypothetical protein
MTDGGRLKMDRAREHIIEAREITRSWLDSDAFTIGRTTDDSTGRSEARVRLQGSPPDQPDMIGLPPSRGGHHGH